MEEIKNFCINYLREVWDIPLAQELVLIIATAVITHWFTSKKLKKEQQQKFESFLGEKVAYALSCVRDVVVSTKTYEIYTEDETISTDEAKNIYMFKEFPMYPSFMNDKETLLDFCTKISSLRSEYEKYLDLKSAAYLHALEKYLISLTLCILCRVHHTNRSLRILPCGPALGRRAALHLWRCS